MPPKRRKVKSDQPADAHERRRDFLGEADLDRLLSAAKRGRHGVRDVNGGAILGHGSGGIVLSRAA